MMMQAGSYLGEDVRPYVPVADGLLRFFDAFYRKLVNWLGKVPPAQAPVLVSARKPITASSTYHQPGYDATKANDNDLMTRWASRDEARAGTLEIDLGAERSISGAWLAKSDFAFTRAFVLEVRQGDTWKEIHRGTTIGPDCPLRFQPMRTHSVRLRILKADGPINLTEFQIFE